MIFGVFTLAKTPLAVLPIKLTLFTAHATTGGALVRWSTSEEKNNAKFETEKTKVATILKKCNSEIRLFNKFIFK